MFANNGDDNLWNEMFDVEPPKHNHCLEASHGWQALNQSSQCKHNFWPYTKLPYNYQLSSAWSKDNSWFGATCSGQNMWVLVMMYRVVLYLHILFDSHIQINLSFVTLCINS